MHVIRLAVELDELAARSALISRRRSSIGLVMHSRGYLVRENQVVMEPINAATARAC